LYPPIPVAAAVAHNGTAALLRLLGNTTSSIN